MNQTMADLHTGCALTAISERNYRGRLRMPLHAPTRTSVLKCGGRGRFVHATQRTARRERKVKRWARRA